MALSTSEKNPSIKDSLANIMYEKLESLHGWVDMSDSFYPDGNRDTSDEVWFCFYNKGLKLALCIFHAGRTNPTRTWNNGEIRYRNNAIKCFEYKLNLSGITNLFSDTGSYINKTSFNIAHNKINNFYLFELLNSQGKCFQEAESTFVLVGAEMV